MNCFPWTEPGFWKFTFASLQRFQQKDTVSDYLQQSSSLPSSVTELLLQCSGHPVPACLLSAAYTTECSITHTLVNDAISVSHLFRIPELGKSDLCFFYTLGLSGVSNSPPGVSSSISQHEIHFIYLFLSQSTPFNKHVLLLTNKLDGIPL